MHIVGGGLFSKSRFHSGLSLKADNGGLPRCDTAFSHSVLPGALYTAVCKQAPSQWPVLSAQTDAALLCPGKRICPFTGFIIAGSQAEVKAAGFFRPFPFTSSASCAIIYFIKGKAAARAALGCRERKKRGFLMSKTIIPANYTPALNLYDTQRAIGTVKRLFADTLCATLNLYRVSAPLFVEASTGLNDDLNGVERKVTFDMKDGGIEAQVVQSLAKWKRKALKDYGFRVGKGLYCDMNAIRGDEVLDNLHSVYVDQWDWEKVIREEDRTEAYLKNVVRSIVSAVCATEMNLHAMFPQLQDLPLHTPNVTFITTQELEDKYPDLTPKERENAFVKENGTTFLMKIGAPLKSGKPHDGRAPDYDDWDLNGDLLFWNEPLQCSYELSSMGIRVSPESMDKQLTMAGCDDRRALPFHKAVLAGELPYTIGGGIGQSRLCMLLLGSVHIGEVQASVWDAETRSACEKAGIPLL